MFRMQIGQPKVGKTEVAKEIIRKVEGKKLVFDFNDDFEDVEGKRLYFEDYHPLVDALTLDEVRILNAGYLKTSKCLLNKAEDIFKETNETAKLGIVTDALERLHASWVDYEMEYARELTHRIPLKPVAKQVSLNAIIDEIETNDVTIIKSKSIHSDHLRAMMYMVLYKVSLREDLKVKVIADEVSTLFFKGNLKLLFEVMNLNKLDILMSCNRPSNIPKVMEDYTTEWSLFKNTDKSEIKWMYDTFNFGVNVPVEDIKFGEYKLITKEVI